MPVLVVTTKTDDATVAFMEQFSEAVLLNRNEPDVFVWLCKNISGQDAASIQRYSGVLGTHFFQV